jgi:hypothetical protein
MIPYTDLRGLRGGDAIRGPREKIGHR